MNLRTDVYKKAEIISIAQSIKDIRLYKARRDSLLRVLRDTYNPQEQNNIKRQIAELEEEMLYV
jgi:hypothetical protein